MTNVDSLSDAQSFVKLWFHENIRVFGDRLVDDADREKLLRTMFEVAKNKLRIKEDIGYFFGEAPLIWADILKGYGDSSRRSYQEAPSLPQVTAALQTFSENSYQEAPSLPQVTTIRNLNSSSQRNFPTHSIFMTSSSNSPSLTSLLLSKASRSSFFLMLFCMKCLNLRSKEQTPLLPFQRTRSSFHSSWRDPPSPVHVEGQHP